MAAFTLRRLVQAIPTLFAVVTVVFLVMRLLPGDPAMAVLGDRASQAALEAMRARMGLNQPLWAQYVEFIGRLARGDLGRSLISQQPIFPEIWSLLPYTLELAFISVLWGLVLGIPAGLVSALRRNSGVDFVTRIVSLLGLSTPSFYLGILLLLLFSVKLGWFPIIGSAVQAHLSSRLYFVTLPSLALGLELAAFISRSTRSTVIDVLYQDYVRTARAKGVSDQVILVKHVLRNALIPVTTVAGVYLGVLLGGSILVETIFSRPGLGKFLIEAIHSRDYVAVESGLVVFASMIVLVNLLVDLGYALIDPRVTYD